MQSITSSLLTVLIVSTIISGSLQSCSGSESASTDVQPVPAVESIPSAIEAKTQFADIKGRKIAYRSMGVGTPIILCNRYRGNLDTWDPAFLDALAGKYQVISFDYTGFGLSTGTPATDMKTFAQDVLDIMEALGMQKAIVGGWSFGGLVAQTFIARYPEKVSHGILIGTGPLGKNETPMEPIFFERSSIVNNTLDDEVVLFFEPQWESSREAARLSHSRIAQRKTDLDVAIPQPLWANYHMGFADCIADKDGLRTKMLTSPVPMMAIMGDHDISFPMQNWYVLLGKLQSTQLIVIPKAGHGPQHEYPELTAQYIHSFILNLANPNK